MAKIREEREYRISNKEQGNIEYRTGEYRMGNIFRLSQRKILHGEEERNLLAPYFETYLLENCYGTAI
jgi:hypothetical protein